MRKKIILLVHGEQVVFDEYKLTEEQINRSKEKWMVKSADDILSDLAKSVECIRGDDRLNFVDSWYKLPVNKLNVMVSFSNRDKQVYMRLMRSNYNGISLTKEEFLELIKNKDITLGLYDGCNKVL